MTTRNIVPNNTGEGEVGTKNKKWQKVNTESVNTDTITADTITTDTITADTITTDTITADTINGDGIPVGDVVFRPYLKDGYLACNGQEINRADYPRLVELANKYSLWTADQSSEPWKFGQGNGSTTMTMPNYKDRVLQGGDTAGKKEAGLPEITGYQDLGGYSDKASNSSGAFSDVVLQDNAMFSIVPETSMQLIRTEFNASKSNSIYGSSTTVQPPAIVLIPQMKY